MKNGLFIIAVALGAALSFGQGRGGPPPPPAGPITRLPDGHPDLQGYWNGPAVTNVQAKGRGGAPGVIVDPANGTIPFRPETAAKVKDISEHHMVDEPTLHCYQTGVPKTMWVQFGFQIVQDPTHIVMLWEFMHQVRIIPINNRPHISANIHLFQGDPIGHWEGDTLVVETTNHGEKNWFDDGGTYKPQTVKVVERFIPVDANTITHEATMTDPSAYTAPWTTRVTLRRAPSKMPDGSRDYEQMEFGCIEGNQDLEHYTEDKGGKAKLKIIPAAKQ